MSNSNVLIKVDAMADLQEVERALKASGVKTINGIAVANYKGAGPHVILTLEGEVPQGLAEEVRKAVRSQPDRSKATFITLVSPDGTAWRVGVDNSGALVASPATLNGGRRGL